MTDEKLSSGQNRDVPQTISAELLCFNLPGEVAKLQKEEAWFTTGRSAKTLAKYPDLRVVLTAIRKGAKIQSHKAEARISIQAVSGRLKLQLPERTVELAGGDLMTLAEDVPHDVEALEDSAFLITIAWHQ
jgi:quercetin dioxygenase-like cupin family protein